ncbi:MAG: glycosyltransferase family 2 protein [Flavobacterium sp.]
MKPRLISIIIPTFNRAHLIGETLDSVLAQTYPHWECLVIDDGSADGTADVVQDYVKSDSRFQYYKRPEDRPKGANVCRNYGFELSQGDFINWFDDDDIMLPDFLKSKVFHFEDQLQFVICSGFFVDEQLQKYEEITFFQTSNLFRDYVLWNLKILTPGVLFRKSYLVKNHLFATYVKRGQETEFFSRIFFPVKPTEYKIIQEYLFLYRRHPLSKSGRNQSYNPSYLESKYSINFDNFNRGDSIGDSWVMNFCYAEIVRLFFNANWNRNSKLALMIRNDFLIKQKNLGLAKCLEIFVISYLIVLFRVSAYRIRNRWLQFKY